MNPLVRNILIFGTVAVLVALIGGFALWVLPVESQIAQLSTQLEQAKNDRDRAKTALTALEASTSVIRQQLDTLALYDLREEQDPENVLQTRSNSQLIQVSKILEEAAVSVSELNLESSEIVPISAASGSTAIASVQKQHFKLHATGFYRNFLDAFERLKKLPPTVAVNNYSLRFVEKAGAQAKLDVTMDVSFNFLMKPVAGSGAGGTGGGSAFEQMMQKLQGKGGFLLERILKVADLFVPPAYAATGRLEVTSRAVRVVPDEPVSFRTFRLRDGRVVVDMPGLRVMHKQSIRVGRSGVRTARLAQFSNHPLVGRLVLDTTHGWVTPRRGERGGVVVALAGPADEPAGTSWDRGPLAGRKGHQEQTVEASGTRARAPEPLVRATPMPAQAAIGALPSAHIPAPGPEPEPVIRRIAVKPWRVGEIRRVAVQPWTGSASQLEATSGDIRRVDVRPEDQLIIVSPALAPVFVNNPTGMAVIAGKQSGVYQVVAAPAGAKPLMPPTPGGASGSSAASDSTGAFAPGRKLLTGLPEIQVGRAEPFFPLFDATDDAGFAAFEASRAGAASPSASASATPPVIVAATPPPPVATAQPFVQAPIVPQIVLQTPPPPQRLAVTLRGVLMSGDRAYGLFDVNGQTIRATMGSSLAPGYQVKAIGRNFALVASPFGTERKELATTWMPVLNTPAFPSAAGAAPAPPPATP